MIQGPKTSEGRPDRVAHLLAPGAIPAGHQPFPTAQTCGAEKPLPTLMTAAAEQTIASAAKLAALQIAVEAMLGHHLAALPQSESLAFKAHLLGLGGYELAERPITAAEAMASFTAAEVSDLVLRASAQETLLRSR